MEADLDAAWAIATKTGAQLRARIARARIFCLRGDPHRALTEVTVFRGAERFQDEEVFVFERLRARLVAGEFLAAEHELSAFMQASTTPTADLYNVLMLGALDPEAARSQLKAFDPHSWLHAIGRHLLGTLSDTELLAAARDLEAPYSSELSVAQRSCEAHYYAGLALERRGAPGPARAHYRACVSTGVVDFQELQFALGRLRAMAPPR